MNTQHSNDAKDAIRQQMEADFLPESNRLNPISAEFRVANALEYIAHHIGQIDKKLGVIVSLQRESQAETKK
jgi:hypothetical protein